MKSKKTKKPKVTAKNVQSAVRNQTRAIHKLTLAMQEQIAALQQYRLEVQAALLKVPTLPVIDFGAIQVRTCVA